MFFLFYEIELIFGQRVNNYRILCQIEDKRLIVLVVAVLNDILKDSTVPIYPRRRATDCLTASHIDRRKDIHLQSFSLI